ncbi:MAG: hypothetical protein WCO56_14930 [Verrucomicrobiota bacterium]
MPANIFAMFRFPHFYAGSFFCKHFIFGARWWFPVLSGALVVQITQVFNSRFLLRLNDLTRTQRWCK